MTTTTETRHAILSEYRSMLVNMAEEQKQRLYPVVAQQVGLHIEILKMLVRDGIIEGNDSLCDPEQANTVAEQLDAARAPVEGQGISAYDAEAKYGFPNATIYNWHKNGWVQIVGTGNYKAKLFNEGDIALARALADLRGHLTGKSVFPSRPRPGRPKKK